MFTEVHGDRPNVPNIAILVTGRKSSVDTHRTIPEAEAARAQGIHIYGVGCWLRDLTELRGIVSRPTNQNLLLSSNDYDYCWARKNHRNGTWNKILTDICPGE